MAEQVEVKVDVTGLEEAMAKWARFSGGPSDTQRALNQFGRGVNQVRDSETGVATPEMYEKMSRAANALRNAEADINKQIAERQRLRDMEYAKAKEALAERNRLYQTPGYGGEAMDAAEDARRRARDRGDALGHEITALQAQKNPDRIETINQIMGQLPRAVEELPRKLDRSLDRFGKVMGQGLALAGLGSGLGIIGQARARGSEFYVTAMESGFMGGGVAGVSNIENSAMGAAGLAAGNATEAARTGIALRRAGARNVTSEQIREFSRLGMFFGMGREGFANIAGEMGNTTFAGGDVSSVRRFGMLGAGMAESAGLTQGQRTYMIESSRHMMEETAKLYGSKPIGVDDWYKGVNSLMQAFRPLNLAGGPMPLIAETGRSLLPAFSPLGKSPADNLRMAIMMGMSVDDMMATGKGVFGGAAQLMSNIGTGPGGVFGGLRQFLNGPLMAGADLDTGAGVDQALLMSNIVSPQVRDVVTRLITTPGALKAFRNAKDVGDLPPDIASQLRQTENQMAGTTGGAWKIADVDFVRDSIKDIAPAVLALERTLKETLGPIGAAVAAFGLGMGGPVALGAALGIGSAVMVGKFFKNTQTGEYVDALQSQSAGVPLNDKQHRSLESYRESFGIPGAGGFDAGDPNNRQMGWIESLTRFLAEGIRGGTSENNDELRKTREALQELTKAMNQRVEGFNKGPVSSNGPRGATE